MSLTGWHGSLSAHGAVRAVRSQSAQLPATSISSCAAQEDHNDVCAPTHPQTHTIPSETGIGLHNCMLGSTTCCHTHLLLTLWQKALVEVQAASCSGLELLRCAARSEFPK